MVICRALLAFCKSGAKDVQVYHDSLQSQGITRQRLASYDRAITADPKFPAASVPGLTRDLERYLVTLEAVHGGGDVRQAAREAAGYS